MNFDIENELLPNLSKGEKFLWTGRPKRGIVFGSSDILFIPFSMLWVAGVIFLEKTALQDGIHFPRLVIIPISIVGLYATAGRFFADAIIRKNTIYAITDTRVIIKSGVFDKRIKSLNIKTISDLSYKEKGNGSGTIILGPTDARAFVLNGRPDKWPGITQPPRLYLINDVSKVYGLLIEQQRKVL